MTFNASIPQPTDNLSDSQDDLLINFGQLNEQFGVDHQAFNTGSTNGNGHHLQVTIDTPLSSSSPTSAQGVYWTKAVSEVTQAFFSNASSSYQLTGQYTLNAEPGGGTGMPSGVQMRWGAIVANTGSNTFTYTANMTNNTNAVQLTPNGDAPASAAYWVSSRTASGFTIQNNTGSSIGFCYLAIGF